MDEGLLRVRVRTILVTLFQFAGLAMATAGLYFLFGLYIRWPVTFLVQSWSINGIGNVLVIVAGLVIAWWPSRANHNNLAQ